MTVQGLPCHIPPVGYVYNRMTGRVERRSVLSRSPNKKAQYWERRGLPAGYEAKRKEEARIQQFNPTHIDVSLEEFRRDAWDKRLNGMWFYNNGEPVYITGLHYYYLEWIYIGGATNNGGYPDFWDSDRKFFYFLQYVIEDPECFGMVYVTRRREGKALAIDTDIPTPDGFKKLADIKEGDYVFDANGDPTLVTFATDVMYGHDCYKVTFDDGSSVIADAEHRWWVLGPDSHAWYVDTTEGMLRNGGVFRIPMVDKSKTRVVASIEKVESVPVKCIQVDNPDHLFLCGRDYIVTHNTSKSVAFLLEGITRNKEANGGIQSKTDDDAEKIVYKSGVLKAFDKLPHFFQPTHNDRAKSKGIRFKPYSDRETDDYLGGWIDYRSSKDTAYDGSKLHRYVGDEVFKTVGCDIRSRHEIVLPCLEDPNGRPYGKCLYTSTVEEMEGRIETYRSFWEESNQKQKDGLTGFTKTKLYRYFLPADDAMDRDKYGYVDKKKNRDFIVAEREQVKDDTKEYFGRMRRKPLSIDEAFRASADSSVYDTIKLQDRFESISWREDLYVQGNFIWKNGEKDTEVIFERSKNGKWKVIWDFIPDSSLVRPHQTRPKPWNNARYAMGCDPYSHSRTVDYRNSAGAFYVYRKHDISEPLKSETFVAQYIARPSSSDLFFEDVIKTCMFFGCEVLIEDNRNNILDYFKYRQYERFAMRLPGRKMPGIPGSTKTHGDIIAFTEAFIYNHLDKVYFKELLDDWINFDPFNTTKFDAAMAAGYTLIANNKYKILLQKKADERMLDIDILFGKN